MPITDKVYKLAYYSVPKNACSSVKKFIYHLKTGSPFDSKVKGKDIHHVSRKFLGSPMYVAEQHANLRANGYFTFCIIRDPIKRFISAYQNKIGRYIGLNDDENQGGLKHKVGVEILNAAGLCAEPDINKYLQCSDLYNQLYKTMYDHTRPHFYFLGGDLGRFDGVYKIEELSVLENDLQDKLGVNIALPHSNKSENKLLFSDLSVRSKKKLLEITESDYRFLANYYSPPQL